MFSKQTVKPVEREVSLFACLMKKTALCVACVTFLCWANEVYWKYVSRDTKNNGGTQSKGREKDGLNTCICTINIPK